MALDRLLYRMLTGSWGRFVFLPGPVVQSPGVSIPVATDPRTLPDAVGVYVHIPFCRSICPFCPYNKVLYEPGLAGRYARCLESEARTVLSSIEDARISSVYFGGGTPLTLASSVGALVDLMRPRLAPDAQVAVEAHPDDVTPSMVRCLADVGVNMISLGVESLDDNILRALGRNHDSAKALRALDVLMDGESGGSEEGKGRLSVNVDLITGIPGQSQESATSDMRRLFALGVDQVSAYPLMDFPFTSMRSQLSLREQHILLDTLVRTASAHGYERTSVWTWTAPGSPKYSSITREDYVGLGAGAASHVDRRFWLNTFNVDAYVGAIAKAEAGKVRPSLPSGFSEVLPAVVLSASMTEKEGALYRLFWQCYEGGFELRSVEAQAIPILPRLVRMAERLGLIRRLPAPERGLTQPLSRCRPVSTQDGPVRLTDRGFFLYHLLERYYTRRYIGRLWQACRESPFPAGLVL